MTPKPVIDRERIVLLALAALLVLVIPAMLGRAGSIFGDGDVSWHIATGQWILAHRAIPRVDPFSFTWAGKPWVPIEWLAEVIYAGAYGIAGYAGVSAVVVLALVALNLIVFNEASRCSGPLATAAAIVGMELGLLPMLLARPHVLAWPLLALWTAILLRARERDRAPPLAAVLLMVVWANLHGSFALGLALVGLFGLEALLESSDRALTIRQWFLFGLASLLATLVNPNGIEGLLQPFRIAHLAMLPLIQEWRPSDPHVTPYFFALLPLVLFAGWWRGIRLPPVRAFLLAALVGFALIQMRQQAVLAITAALLLPRAFSTVALDALATEQILRSATERRALALGLPVAVAALVLGLAAVPMVPPDTEEMPRGLIAHIPPQLRGRPVINSYSMGGPLILAGIRPYIDGRGDMYGDQLVLDYRQIIDGDPARFEAAVKQWNIGWTIFANNEAVVRLLDRSPQWKRVYSDKVGVIHVRCGGQPNVSGSLPAPASAARPTAAASAAPTANRLRWPC